MKTHDPQLYIRSALGFGVLCCLAAAPLLAAEATPHPSGPPKVRVLVKENNLASTAGGTGGAVTPAPAAAKPGGPQAGAKQAMQMSATDAEKYTHTTKKSLAVEVSNLTAASMDVNVKTTFLAKDEAPGKHEVVPEKTVENKLTIAPANTQAFTTEEVSFAHTTAHRQPMQGGGGGAGGGRGGSRGAMSSPVPSSGHAYFGYKVEVFQGNELVGSTASESH